MNRTVGMWISIVGVVVLAATAAGGALPSPSRVVNDPENRFTISVPATWKVETSTSARAPAVVASAPAAPGQIPDSVNVITQDLVVPISPQTCAGEAEQVMRYTIHHWTTLHEGAATLAGHPAYSRSYVWHTSTGEERRSIQTCVTLGRRAFVLVGTTANTASGANEVLPKLEAIMGTFHPNIANLPTKEKAVEK